LAIPLKFFLFDSLRLQDCRETTVPFLIHRQKFILFNRIGAGEKTMSNVIPFPGRMLSPWFYIGEESIHENLLAASKGHPVCSVQSEEDLLKGLSQSRPAFVLIRADLSWTDPLQLVPYLEKFCGAPIVLILKKQKSKKQEAFIREAYQAGIFDILYLPFNDSEVEETLDVIRRISKKVMSH